MTTFKAMVGDCEFSSVGMRSAGCGREGVEPTRVMEAGYEIQFLEMSSATGSPRLADLGGRNFKTGRDC